MGFLSRDIEKKNFRLGKKLHELIGDRTDLPDEAGKHGFAAYLKSLSSLAKETVLLSSNQRMGSGHY